MEEERKVLKHLGIIPDGNRRYAKEKGLPAIEGHRRGAERIRETVNWCAKRGIRFLTIFVFSTENWQRDKKEVNGIMMLMGQFLDRYVGEIHKEGGRIRGSGRIEELPISLVKKIEKAEELTKNNTGITLNMLLSYGGKAEIVDACKKLVREAMPESEIDEQKISQAIYSPDIPDVDLVIRTGDEHRTSGFMTWRTVYSEFYSCQNYWPDFSEEDLDLALAHFAEVKRNFGK